MTRTIVNFLLAFLLITSSAFAGDDDRSPQIIPTRDGDVVALDLFNPLPYEVTVTIDVAEMTNLRADHEFPITLTLGSQRKSPLGHLTLDPAAGKPKFRPTIAWQPGSPRVHHDADALYLLPFEAGYAFRLSQGNNGQYTHQGKNATDWALPEGTPICAARDGKVVGVRESYSEGSLEKQLLDKANVVMIRHDDGTIAAYAHLRKDGVNLLVGDWIRAGSVIGYSGNTGYTSGPHLHFEVYKPIDGSRTETYAVKFHTAEGDSAELEEGRAYMRPYKDQKPGELRAPANLLAGVMTCRTLNRKGLPADDIASFRATDVMNIFVGINVPDRYVMRIECTAGGAGAEKKPAFTKQFETDAKSRGCRLRIDLAAEKRLRGECEVHVYIDDKPLTSAKFKVE